MLTPNVVTFRQVQDFKTNVVVPIRSIILMKFQEWYNVVSMFYRLSSANKSWSDFLVDKVLICKCAQVSYFLLFSQSYTFNIVIDLRGNAIFKNEKALSERVS